MMTDKDVEDFEKMLTNLKAQGVVDTKVKVGDLKILLDDRGPSDLTRRIDELEKENKTLQEKLSKLQKLMFDQFRNKGDMQVAIKHKIKIKEPKFLDQYKAEEEAFPTDDVMRFEEHDEKEYKRHLKKFFKGNNEDHT